MAKAKDNEKIFLQIFNEKVLNVELLQQKSYSIKDAKSRKLSSSVDFYLEYEGRQLLIELDSYNMAKVVVGQYVLLNQLRDETLTDPIFLVIHTYKGYNPERTTKYLDCIYEREINNGYIPYGAIHIDQFKGWCGGTVNEFIELFKESA